jgi:hypothetical protein
MAPVFYQAITNPQDRYVTELAEDYYKIMVAKRQSLLPEHFEYSGAKLPPFRAKVATHSGGWLPPIPGHGCHFSGV